MHDLAAPLILALIALQAMIMLDPIVRPALPVAGIATLMSLVAITILPSPIPVSAPIAISGWVIAVFATVMALSPIRRRSARQERLHAHLADCAKEFPHEGGKSR